MNDGLIDPAIWKKEAPQELIHEFNTMTNGAQRIETFNREASHRLFMFMFKGERGEVLWKAFNNSGRSIIRIIRGWCSLEESSFLLVNILYNDTLYANA